MTESLHLAEINHRIANSFQVMSALATLEAREAPFAAEPLGRVAAQLSAFALVHRILQPATSGMLDIECSAYLKALCIHLDNACLAPLGVKLTTVIGQGRLETRLCQQLGLIITELVMNAVKHAFQLSQGGQLEIGLSCNGAGGCVAWVKDDGPGFDFNSFASSRGLGLVYRLTRAVNGECGYQSSPAGTHVLLRFPGGQRDGDIAPGDARC